MKGSEHGRCRHACARRDRLPARHSDVPFAGGKAPNIVDACLVPQMFNARRVAVDLALFARVTAIADRASALSAVKSAAPPTT